jgi:hypothetical protein
MNLKFLYIFLLFFFSNLLSYDFQKIKYQFSNQKIDVVIPCHEKDAFKLEYVIKGIKKNVKNLNRIIIVSSAPFTHKAEWFNEKYYPFSKKDIETEITQYQPNPDEARKSIKNRIGWIYQQLLKLYAAFVIPDISDNILVVDADTIFLRKISFQHKHGAPLFNPGGEYNEPYFVQAAKLIPGFTKVFRNYSGICHHMLFQRCILEDLFNVIQQIHNVEPWKAICRCIDPKEWSGFSEYELYFNFIFLRSDQGKIRKLKWYNTSIDEINQIDKIKAKKFDYASFHTWQ